MSDSVELDSLAPGADSPEASSDTRSRGKRRAQRKGRKMRQRKDPEGRMPLIAHLRELRNRFVVSLVTLLVCAVPGWMGYETLLNTLTAPLKSVNGDINFGSITSPLAVQIQVSLFVALILSSPMWIYQIWAFIVPGLRKNEKWTALAFMVSAIPLFIAGCVLAYYTLPKAIVILIGFTPDGAINLIPANDYLTFATRFIVAFGLAFLLPVFLVGLNLIGILPSHLMLKGWRFAVVGIFIFAALITPTPDPWTMFGLALPMIGLYFAAYGVARFLDWRKAKKRPDWSDLADDEASPLEPTGDL